MAVPSPPMQTAKLRSQFTRSEWSANKAAPKPRRCTVPLAVRKDRLAPLNQELPENSMSIASTSGRGTSTFVPAALRRSPSGLFQASVVEAAAAQPPAPQLRNALTPLSKAWLVGLPLVLLAHGYHNPWPALWEQYNLSLAEHPFVTKVATGVVGVFIGDLVAQAAPLLLNKQQSGTAFCDNSGSLLPGFKYDLPRVLRQIAFSLLLATPVASLWMEFLDHAVFPAAPTSPQAVVTKMLMDQLLMAPVMTCIFFFYMSMMDKGNAAAAVRSIKEKIVPTLKANYCLWPLAHIINFAMVPSSMRILYINIIAIGWTTFMSYMASSKPGPEAVAKGQAAAGEQ